MDNCLRCRNWEFSTARVEEIRLLYTFAAEQAHTWWKQRKPGLSYERVNAKYEYWSAITEQCRIEIEVQQELSTLTIDEYNKLFYD